MCQWSPCEAAAVSSVPAHRNSRTTNLDSNSGFSVQLGHSYITGKMAPNMENTKYNRQLTSLRKKRKYTRVGSKGQSKLKNSNVLKNIVDGLGL